jgi:hypothetical protein
MGRPSQGWKLHRKPGRRYHTVKFTHAGKAYELGTGHEDESKAAIRAAELYAAVVSGNAGPGKRKRQDTRAIGPVAAEWITSLTLDPETIESYARYCETHFVPFFKNVESLTSARVTDYAKTRLGCVLAKTLKKELGALKALCGFVGVVVTFSDSATALIHGDWRLKKKVTGTRHKKGKRSKVALSPAEVVALLAKLPERKTRWARSAGVVRQRTDGQPELGWPVRARYVVAYGTSLRPETLDLLSVPEHYTKGATHLTITDEIDKARFSRSLPLTEEVRAALDAIVPDSGPIFGHFTNRKLLRNAARAAGIEEARASRLTVYDIRRAALTHWADAGKLTAAQWMAGHRRISTTAIYAQGSLRAAEEAILSGR